MIKQKLLKTLKIPPETQLDKETLQRKLKYINYH